MEWPDSSLKKVANGTKEIQWTLRTDSEAYLDGLEAKLKRTKVPTSNLLPPTSNTTSSLGLQPQPEDMSELDFGDEEDEEDELAGDPTEEGGREEAGQEGEEEEAELIDDALLDDPGLALLWDSPRELNPQTFTSSPLPPQPPPPPSSVSSSLLLPSSPPSPIPVRPRSQSITFDDHLLQPPLNSYTSTLTNSTTTTHSNSTSSSSASPSTSYTRPNRFLNSSSPTPNRDHPHRDRTLSRSRSRSSFTTISESPSPPGSLTPTSLHNQHLSLPQPVPVAEPPVVRRSVRFNPRTLLRPSSFGSYSSDRSGELVSSSPLRGFMAWRLGGGPKPNNGNGRTSPNGSSASSSTNPRNARVQKMPQVQSWTNYYGTFSNTSADEIRGNPLLYEPIPRPSSSRPPHDSSVRKSEEDVLFGTGVWERVSSLDWWCWKMGLGAWWESEGGMCCGTGWEEDDWGEREQSGSSRTARAVGEGRGFF